MTNDTKNLFEENIQNTEISNNFSENNTTGIVPSQKIRKLILDKTIISLESTIEENQIQPASIDLRLSSKAYRVRASFLPGKNSTVQKKLNDYGMHEIDLLNGAVLEKGAVYIVPLQESISLTKRYSGIANPKSSIGRLDIFTRLITDNCEEFDRVNNGYKGKLYAEISPRTFSIVVRKGSKLLQLRIRKGSPRPSDSATRRLHDKVSLIESSLSDKEVSKRIRNGVPVSINLSNYNEIIGYKAKNFTPLIDIDKVNFYQISDFWEPIFSSNNNSIILDPNAFYILASKEALTVPPNHAAEMEAFNPLHGEFRVHYAGFFDPGFGHSTTGGSGSKAVLEIRSYEVPFLLEDGQVVCRLIYERLTEDPDKLYGANTLNSNYQAQKLKLSKHFKSE
ncbi:2'-deoxycytidine 5'-triphosphate deaminase [Alphaproteobacteria bacterium]|nr:2'-deoxycytidine 5'-triphosphate deaminase [Alphaproteobacteria bacterium]